MSSRFLGNSKLTEIDYFGYEIPQKYQIERTILYGWKTNYRKNQIREENDENITL